MNIDNNLVSLILSFTCLNLLGEDLWVEIFKRLPIQSLCRFRCVCKSWNSLISSAFFINLHYSFTSSITPFRIKPYLLEYNIYHPQDLAQPLTKAYFPFRHREFPQPVVNYTIKQVCPYDVVDVVHGVVCALYSINYLFEFAAIWNPAILKYVAPPKLSRLEAPLEWKIGFPSAVGLGFGYDSSKNDFKILRVWIPSSYKERKFRSLPSTFEVYSSQQGIWKKAIIDNIKSYQFVAITSCFINGIINWVVSIPSARENGVIYHTYSLLMFDCVKETFSTMPLPEEINRFEIVNDISQRDPQGVSLFVKLVKYSGMLSLLMYTKRDSRLELWVMEEYGVSRSWKKFFGIRNEVVDPDYAIMLRDDGDVYQTSMRRLATYDPNKWIKLRGVKRFFQPLTGHIYEESMFLMDDPKARTFYSKNKEQLENDYMFILLQCKDPSIVAWKGRRWMA